MVKVKICGITNERDALWAVNLGVDYIGLNFWKDSPRKVSVQIASRIVEKIPRFVEVVGVFVNEEIKRIKRLCERCRFTIIQLHGKEPPEYCIELKQRLPGIKVIKAFQMKDKAVLDELSRYDVDYYLLDSYVPGVPGGTGEVFNWDMAVEAKERGKPIFLAGGLSPENVMQAIEKVSPYAVDVASGVEKTPRRKDYNLMRDFISKVRMRR